MNLSFFVAIILILPILAHGGGTLEQLQLEDMQGLLPSHWMDNSGFEVEGEKVFFNESLAELPVVPLLPLFKTGGFGKRTYVGGVIEGKYLENLGPSEIREAIDKINQLPGPNGVGFRVIGYQGKLYAIRRDFQVNYVNSTTIGLSLSFGGGGNTVVLGESTSIGMKLDFGAPFRISEEKGFNLVGNLQTMIDDWSVGLNEDETQKIIDQSVTIAPALISYIMEKPLALKNDEGHELESIEASKNENLSLKTEKPSLLAEGNFSKELKKIRKNILKNLKKELEWKETVAPQVSAEKIISSENAQELIQEVCDRLASVYEVPKEIWPRCRVSATLTPNAWAYPGGDIFITAGLLGILSDLDSVALVLGHEIGHVMARHMSKQALLKKTHNYAATIISTAVNLGLTAFSLGGGWGTLGTVNFLTWYPQMLISQVGGAYLSKKGMEIAFLAPVAGLMMLSREHETQADRIGQEVAYSSGADLEKMTKGWEEFVNFFDTYFPQELGLKERIMRDHPDSKVRLKNFEKKASDLNDRLKHLHDSNSIDSGMKQRYKSIHRIMRVYAHSYGRALREKLDKIQHGNSKLVKEHKLRNFISTISGPQSLCIRHALGAQ